MLFRSRELDVGIAEESHLLKPSLGTLLGTYPVSYTHLCLIATQTGGMLSYLRIHTCRQTEHEIGTGVMTENSIIAEGASVINSVKIQDCFVGEACQLSNEMCIRDRYRPTVVMFLPGMRNILSPSAMR